ncbi:MFS transporter [Nocardioides panacis]|uniref:MFS transporter n=1 Tax=Nocardioides panacis TaxID=2849501 RepID=A0A975SYF7_9ACTN|nr:MFS transporter [Nocardioides panacis]QWZ07554.1 MFS transporter [Nocardioides panacis]
MPSPTRAPQTVALALVLTVVMTGGTLPSSVYRTYEQSFGFGLVTVTVVYASYAAGVLVALVAFGQWSDVLGRRPLLAAGLVAAVLSAGCFLLADGVAVLLVGRLLSGLSAGIFVGTATAAVTETARGSWTRRAPLVATTANVTGLGLGPLLGGLLVAWAPAPMRTPYAVHLGLCLAGLVVVALLPESAERAGPAGARLHRMRLAVPEEVRPFFVATGALGLAAFAVLGLFTAVTPTIAAEVLGVTGPVAVALLISTFYVGSAVGQVALTRLGEGTWERVAAAALVTGMALLALAMVTGWWPVLVLGGLVSGLGHGVGFSQGLATLVAHTPDGTRAAVTSAYFAVVYVGMSVPVVVEGLTSAAVGVVPAGVGFAAVVAATVAGAYALSRRSGRRARPGATLVG